LRLVDQNFAQKIDLKKVFTKENYLLVDSKVPGLNDLKVLISRAVIPAGTRS